MQNELTHVMPTTLEWEADEFFYHHKNFIWYVQMLIGSVLISLVPWLLSGREDYISGIVIFVALFSLTIYVSRKPKKHKYKLTSSTLTVENQSFGLFDFSRYWIEEFPTHTQITLVGTKRTAMPVALYLTDKDVTKKVLEIIQAQIPQTNPSNNPADWLTRRLKF